MTKILLLSGILVLTSCQSMKSNPEREPTNFFGYTEIQQCGEIGNSESNRNALNDEDRMYTLRLQCNKNLLVGIPVSQVKLQQKAYLTRWRKQAVKVQKNPSALPYVCMKFLALKDPCLAGESVLGYQPKFTSKVNFGAHHE